MRRGARLCGKGFDALGWDTHAMDDVVAPLAEERRLVQAFDGAGLGELGVSCSRARHPPRTGDAALYMYYTG